MRRSSLCAMATACAVATTAAHAQQPESSGTLRGRVVDVLGAPCAAVAIELRDLQTDRRVASGRTDGSGEFVCGRVGYGSYRVWATGDDARGGTQVWIGPPQPLVAGVEIIAVETAAVRGQAVDAEGQPIAGAEVIAASHARLFDRTVTDDRGHFELRHAPIGDCEISAWQPRFGYAHRDLDGFAVGPRSCSLRLDAAAGAHLQLKVPAAADQLRIVHADVRVSLRARNRIGTRLLPPSLERIDRLFDASGVASLRGIPAEITRVSVSLPGTARSASQRVKLTPEETQHVALDLGVDRLRVSERQPASGLLVTDALEPLAHHVIVVDGVSITTDADGRFETPTPKYRFARFRVGLGDPLLYLSKPEVIAKRQPSQVVARPAAAITGQIETATGKPAQRVQVTLKDTADGRWRGATTTDPAGVYRFGHLPPDPDASLWVVVESGLGDGAPLGSGESPPSGPLRAGEMQQLDVRLAPVFAVEGRAVSPEGAPLTGIWLAADRLAEGGPGFELRTDRRGRFRLRGAPAGTYRLTARRGNSRATFLGEVQLEVGGSLPAEAGDVVFARR